MQNKDRYIQPLINDFLKSRMVFIGGPRQVGKTTLCLSYLNPPERQNPNYLNWDDLKSKTLLRKGEIPHAKLIVIDEIHKYKEWRNLLKGFYDKRPEGHNFLVTGSARLDHYRRGGDSLLGRYRYLRLHPFSVGELKIRAVKKEKKLYIWDWSAISGEGFRFEKLVASHLLKYCHYMEDTEGDVMELQSQR